MSNSQLRATLVDPRDIVSEIETPVFRVYFMNRMNASSEHRLENCDVEAALQWARENQEDRSYDLWVEYPNSDEKGLLLLLREPAA